MTGSLQLHSSSAKAETSTSSACALRIAPAREDGAHYERSIVVPHTDIHARLAVLRELPVEGRAVLEDLNSGGS